MKMKKRTKNKSQTTRGEKAKNWIAAEEATMMRDSIIKI